MKHELQIQFPQEIKSVYYQKDNEKPANSKTNLYIEFNSPLSKTILLDKVHFDKQSVQIEEINSSKFVAHFKNNNIISDLILDADAEKEYGNKAPVIKKTDFDLKSDEAILEYRENDKIHYFKITDLIEKNQTLIK
ncbi:hypothetical protein RCH18_000537 [Flavobacterium sp. PL11]|jgi:hypothetical protein|uniref:hypothetical protein n=1 Tax=Flavobacterium sp. PL11 TaxID=3071717 RepID=UPI002E0834DD|nr:hypothetical protein [Flavobacterium sp. PL11]